MNKKFLTIVLVVLLTMTSVFAYRGEMKVGANLGYGLDGYGYSVSPTSSDVTVKLYGGIYAAGTFQYGLTDSLYAKAEVGVNTFYEFITSTTGGTPSRVDTNSRTTNALVSAALVYDIPIGRIFAIDLQIGVDSILGKPSVGAEKFNASIGVGFGSGFVVNITDDISLSYNSKISLYFANTNSAYRDVISKNDYILIGAQNNIGITYSL